MNVCVSVRACVRACESEEEEDGGKKWEEKTCAENKSKTIRLNKNNLKLIVSILYILGIPTVHIDGLSWLAYKRINTSSHHHHHLRLSLSLLHAIHIRKGNFTVLRRRRFMATHTHSHPSHPTNQRKKNRIQTQAHTFRIDYIIIFTFGSIYNVIRCC